MGTTRQCTTHYLRTHRFYSGKDNRRHEIVVPARFFKVVAVPYTGTPRGIAFIFDNEAEQPSLKELAITIDSVERVTGIDFFHNLPDSIEHKIESDLSLEIWNLN